MDNEKEFIKAHELYERGELLSAFNIFHKSAENGDTDSMLQVASMYSAGEGVRYNLDKAEEWELKSIDAGSLTAMINLAITYRMKGNILKSKTWFKKALESGDGTAALELAKLYLVSDRETDTVREYLEKALIINNMCDDDVEEAQKMLSEL